jgi:hypothetical protein
VRARKTRHVSRGTRRPAARDDAKRQEWLASYGRRPLPDANGAADELAGQIEEFMRQDGEITIDDVRKAIDRRFGAG